MKLYEILVILIVHWIADFVCQTDEMALGKSKRWKPLLDHTSLYTGLFFIPMLILFTINSEWSMHTYWVNAGFLGMTFICHTAIDYYTSRAHSQFWQEKKNHAFFTSIGFDQLLHYFQLFITYYLLKQL